MRSLRYLLFVALLAFFLVGGAFAANTGKIVGRVVDAETGEGLANVNVVILGTTMGATTDLDGLYFILNVSPGTYEVKASEVTHAAVTYSNVKVATDRTTRVDFELNPTVIEAEEVVFVSKRPMIRKDATDSRTTRTAEDIAMMPVENVKEVVKLTVGAVGSNFRGGRASEVNYIIDGASFVDPMTGTYEGFVPAVAFEEVSVITGGQSVEYGNSLSGVVNQVTKEGGERFNGNASFRTNDMGGGDTFIGERDRLRDLQGSVSGPIPFFKNAGKLYFLLSGQYFDTRGRFDNDDSTLTSGFGKLTYKLTPKHKLTFSGTVSNAQYSFYNHLWSHTTVEDRLGEFRPTYVDGNLDPSYPFLDANNNPWYNNGQVDTEDLNHNGVLDPGEDLNDNGVIDSEDLNNNFGLDAYRMLDHVPFFNHHTEQYAVKWNHTLSQKTFYEIGFSRYKTEMHYNTSEYINEDANANGQLDLEPRYSDVNAIPSDTLNMYRDYLAAQRSDDGKVSFYFFDFNQNGVYEYEDLNGNGVWDWDVYGTDTDLFRDEDDDGYIDASQNGSQSTWMRWEDVPFGNSRDNDDFYTYGSGFTYNRARWNNDYKIINNFNANITSQVHQYHQLKSGVELKFMELFDHDVDMASGGNVYGQNFKAKPRLYGIWAEDKMEFEGMVINAGLRLDVFDINWDDYPSDVTDPVVDPSEGGQVKDPVQIEPKKYWGPRLGIAFPITEYDLLSFNYSKNFQIPILRFAFTNVNWDFSGAFPIIGNPNLDPERTTAYELTLRHQFNPNTAIVATGFYKDITGLTDTRQVFYTERNWYGLYINLDYGNVRGFELSFEKRFSNFYSTNISYSYSVAKGKASNSRQNYENAWAGNVIRTTESYLDWDQRHTIYGNVMFMIPENTRLTGNNLIDKPLELVSLSLIGRYGSGLPFSSPAKDKDPPINDQRLPYTLSFDGRVQKRHSFSENLGLYVYLQVYNLFNRENIDQRFFQNNADTGWYMADQDGDGEVDYDVDGKYNDPRYFQRGRMYQVGIGLDF